MTEMKALQNGSDIRGIAIATKERAADLTIEAVEKIGWGLVSWLRKEQEETYQAGSLTVGVGRDSRISGPGLKDALVQSLVSQGVNVIDFGLATTPAMFMATQFEEFKCDASVMLTASHLPYEFNGLKFFRPAGGAEKEDVAWILSAETANRNEKTGKRKMADILGPYAKDLVGKIRKGIGSQETKPLAGWHIVVDAGNGSGGFFAEYVLQELGADTTGSQFLAPDGYFPNHIPNPDNKEAMASIKQAVLENEADLGVIFDTDVDRSAVVTASGQVINRNNLIAVLSTMVLSDHPGARIVTNSPTSTHLQRFIEAKGGIQVRYISGYRNVINKAIELNKAGLDTPLAIETSGHAAFKENYFLDDGAYVIAKILMMLPDLRKKGLSLDDQIKELAQPVEVQEIRLRLNGDDPKGEGQQIIEGVAEQLEGKKGMTANTDNEEGIRYDLSNPYGSGWFLLRLSLHEPLLVLQIENDEAGKNLLVLKELANIFAEYPTVDPLIIDKEG